jgi:hypothetical protein
MNERFINIILVLFTLIGFTECLNISFWLMDQSSTFAFYGGVLLAITGLYTCWQVMTNLLKSIFKK